ncbi:hypothetical protein TNCT_621381 [Trichonephila clavata]|uniref:Uncharacterized protein n=1 Tax=Trichonephila clavata TaxID=2740835 RepID=A0A8X6KBP3_TRICU|nr:hypothetical protein TNCT_621381 [Trichonephila clavata]
MRAHRCITEALLLEKLSQAIKIRSKTHKDAFESLNGSDCSRRDIKLEFRLNSSTSFITGLMTGVRRRHVRFVIKSLGKE